MRVAGRLCRWLPALSVVLLLHPALAAPEGASAMLTQDRAVGAAFRFGGPMGDRIEANIDNWLLVAPDANPGFVEFFRLRVRQTNPDFVPWAGEFAGKYLVSLVQATRMTGDPRLGARAASFVADLLSRQDEDGYLGPFPREERLLGHWDLWGHYYIVLGLLAWYEDTGDEAALAGARRIGDCVCATFLGTGKRVIDAGSHEMNMAMIHGLGALHRHTGEARYLRMMREIEQDWEGAGDYFRTGVARVDFHRTPRPRWESLADLQGLLELYRITGDPRYREALLEHWSSIRVHDRHPSGAYSTSEQSIGNPYTPGAIETCCTIAWAALTLDVLRATGSPLAADELELTTWNAILGAQHPSGRWWTYDTPMDGVRLASAHSIVFQARQGTPELNCCSVHGPRGLGLLSEWAVMCREGGLAVSYYGPMECRVRLPDGADVLLTQETAYPAEGTVRIRLGLRGPSAFPLWLRIPGWSAHTEARVNEEKQEIEAAAGTSLRLEREWRDGDTITLRFDLTPRYWAGELARSGLAAVYVGPILLAYDQRCNPDDAFSPLDPGALPSLDVGRIALQPVEGEAGRFPTLVEYEARGGDGRTMRLCDYATAGALGTAYRAWLPVTNALPAWLAPVHPTRDAAVGPGPLRFEWTGADDARLARTYELEVAADAAFERVVHQEVGLTRPRLVLAEGLPEGAYYWRVRARNVHGVTEQDEAPATFRVDPSLPAGAMPPAMPADGVLLRAALDGGSEPTVGRLVSARDVTPCEDRAGRPGGALALNGASSMLVYGLPAMPEEDYTLAAWVRPEGLPYASVRQIASCWCRVMDDPLRLCIEGESLFGRIEAGNGFSTGGHTLRAGEWVHAALVKQGAELRLYAGGALVSRCVAPWTLASGATEVGIGGNPRYTGANEFLRGAVDDVLFLSTALTDEEIAALAAEPAS